jgi:anti-sigma factor RsiW
MNSSNCDHLSQDLIYRTLDDELTTAERFECESHLAVCDVCRQKLISLQEFSADIEAVVQSTVIPSMDSVRSELLKAMENDNAPAAALHNPAKVMRRFGWGMGIAATLALGVLLAPRHELKQSTDTQQQASHLTSAAQAAPIEIDGETFLPVPYSNADLQTSAPHIVEMQVPIASLADVGIVLEPVTNRVGAEGADADGSVLADVLVGADGQPRGVHVLEFE